MIIDHTSELYVSRWQNAGVNRYNGAFYYSREIVSNIIPLIDTDRNWITVNIPVGNHEPQFSQCGCDHSIVFIHNNLHPENYDWLSKYKDLILVCGIEETLPKVEHLGHPIYLPLSIDVQDVRSYRKKKKTKETAFAGRLSKDHNIPDHVDRLSGMPRIELLEKMAEYKKVYAVGRTAIEAKVLGCKILPYDERFPDVRRWKVLDNKDASVILQKKLDEIDKGGGK